MFQIYNVKLSFTGKLCGSTPMNPEMIRPWIEARRSKRKPPYEKSLDEIEADVKKSLPVISSEKETGETDQEMVDRITLGFQKNEDGLVMRGGTMKAHIKDCARILSTFSIGKIEGEKSFAVRVLNCLNVVEYWISILRNGKPVKEADDYMDKSVHVQTMRGPRNALKKILYIEKAMIEFNLSSITNTNGNPVVDKKDLEKIFEYGAVHGYGGERGDGEGRYAYAIEETNLIRQQARQEK